MSSEPTTDTSASLFVISPHARHGLEHVVLLCRDVETSLAYYCGVLGLEGVDVERWHRGEVRFPSARVSADTIIDLMPGTPDGRNTDHICLVIEPTDLYTLAKRTEFNPSRGRCSEAALMVSAGRFTSLTPICTLSS